MSASSNPQSQRRPVEKQPAEAPLLSRARIPDHEFRGLVCQLQIYFPDRTKEQLSDTLSAALQKVPWFEPRKSVLACARRWLESVGERPADEIARED